MNAFQALLALSESEKKRLGVEFTPGEIAQQPEMWLRTGRAIVARKKEIEAFLLDAGIHGAKEPVVILTGAGSSEFVGNSVVYTLRDLLKCEVMSVPTTHLVTHAHQAFLAGHKYLLISFARSGNSPESLEAYASAKRFSPGIKQIVITCNEGGKLAQAAKSDRDTLYLPMPPETNDKSLVMTSSFSSMAFAAICLGLLERSEEIEDLAQKLGGAARRIMEVYGDELKEFASMDCSRACFLGANALFGTMQECHLKLQEMTDGKVACRFDSFLGLRHGPQVFVKSDCAVVAALSRDAHVRKYEMDMLRELRVKKQGCGILVICDKATAEISDLASVVIELFPGGETMEDGFRPVTDVVAGQILGVFKSMHLGLKPDVPSVSGTISRVVQGVTIYQRPEE